MIGSNMFFQFVGETRLNDLCCFWTGWDFLPPRREVLIAKFSSNKRSKLPTSETCFLSLVLPVGHETYGDFLNAMDTAIKCGSRGFAYAWTSSLSLIKRLSVLTNCQLYSIQLKSLLLCFKSLFCKAFCLGSLAHSGLVEFDWGPHVTIFKVF